MSAADAASGRTTSIAGRQMRHRERAEVIEALVRAQRAADQHREAADALDREVRETLDSFLGRREIEELLPDASVNEQRAWGDHRSAA